METKKILVIEDNELNMKLVRKIFGMFENFDVFEAQNAESGLRIAQSEKPDLILMDIQLPGMDGLEATKILKADENFKTTPIIALTGFAMQSDMDAAYDAGCDDYVSKPIELMKFIDKITEWTGVPPPSFPGGV